MQRRLPWILCLALLVALAHLWLTQEVSQLMANLAPNQPGIKRMEAAYVRELKLSQAPRAPMLAAPMASPAAKSTSRPKPKPRKKAQAAQTAQAASAPDTAPSAPLLADAASSPASTPEAAIVVADASASSPTATASSPAQANGAAVPASQAASSPPTFVWPKATRVSYKLEGNYRGPIYGQASVEWLRQGQRYQVHVDASLGPSFAPLGSWRLSSEGEIRPEGLYPRRYENVNRLLMKTKAPRIVQLHDDEVVLEKDKRVPRTADVQDPASQFVQLAYRFMLNPGLLKTGNTIHVPLVTLKRAETLAYDVLGEETLETPVGKVQAIHVRPRRIVADGGVLPADIWFAPGLQYLPVRVQVKLDDVTFMDMRMSRAPQQAADDSQIGKAATPP